MDDWLVIVLVIVGLIAMLIPVVMVGRIVYAIIAGIRDDRHAEARRITKMVPELGEFSTTDNCLWFGYVRGLQVTLDCPGEPPTEAHAKRVRVLLDQLPALVDKAQVYLAAHEDMSWLTGDAAGFEPFGIEPEACSEFVLELIHPSDPDGVYRVEFRDGVPVSSGRDD